MATNIAQCTISHSAQSVSCQTCQVDDSSDLQVNDLLFLVKTHLFTG